MHVYIYRINLAQRILTAVKVEGKATRSQLPSRKERKKMTTQAQLQRNGVTNHYYWSLNLSLNHYRYVRQFLQYH